MLNLASSADTKDTSLTLSKQTPALTDSMSYLGSSRECSPSYLGRCSISDSGSMSPDMHILQIWSRQLKARIQDRNSPQQDSAFQFELHCQVSTLNESLRYSKWSTTTLIQRRLQNVGFLCMQASRVVARLGARKFAVIACDCISGYLLELCWQSTWAHISTWPQGISLWEWNSLSVMSDDFYTRPDFTY